jgi:hypothetical protein
LPCPAITKRAVDEVEQAPFAGVCECGALGSPDDSPIATRVTTEGTTAAPGDAELAPWVIPVAVVAGLLVLIIVVIVVVFFTIMHRKRTVQAGPGTQKPARVNQQARVERPSYGRVSDVPLGHAYDRVPAESQPQVAYGRFQEDDHASYVNRFPTNKIDQ